MILLKHIRDGHKLNQKTKSMINFALFTVQELKSVAGPQ